MSKTQTVCPVHSGLKALADHDPYGFFADALAGGPVRWDETMNGLLVLGYEECEQVLKDARTFPMAWGLHEGGLTALGAYGIFNLTGERHIRMHHALLAYFDPDRNPSLRPTVERIIGDVLASAIAGGDFEFGDDVADVVTGLMALNFLGLPEDEALLGPLEDANTKLQRYMQSNGDDRAALAELEQAKSELRDLFFPAIQARRRQPGTDLISLLLTEFAEHGEPDDVELATQCLFYFGASHGNTANALTNIAFLMLSDPELEAGLRAGGDHAIQALVDESLRVWAAVQFRVRIAAVDTELAGVPITAGTRLIPVVASANRDPRRYSDPERLDPQRRSVKRHLTFGIGARYCVGASLARLESEVTVRLLLEHRAQLPVIDSTEPPLFRGFNYRGFRPLPITAQAVLNAGP